MNNIKTKFSIKDLENLSGIKAHTIRIWEKRYNLFQPNRTQTNIRYYSLKSLQKLLNISYLNSNGYKVSKIAQLSAEDIPLKVKEIAENNNNQHYAVNLLKISMLNFDQVLFYNTFNELKSKMSFHDIFYDVFVPLFEDIGLLWQTDTITPAHEHFIFELIKQKILVYTEKAISSAKINEDTKKTYVLFLPDNEIHELGLLFINLELTSRGHRSIYLGQSVPIDSLEYLKDHYNEIIFISSFTIKPDREIIDKYLEEFTEKILIDNSNLLLISGRQMEYINASVLNRRVTLYTSTKEVLESLDNYKQQVG